MWPKKKKKKPVEPKNLLDLIPEQAREWEEAGEGKIRILVPKFGDNWLGRKIKATMKNPNYYVNLDEFGSFVWRFIDGKHTVYAIGMILRERFGEAVENRFDRLGLFFQQLERGKFIRWKPESEEKKTEAAEKASEKSE